MKLHTKDGSQIDYQTYGSPTKPALLLLHGNNGSQQDFKAYLPSRMTSMSLRKMRVVTVNQLITSYNSITSY